MERQPREQPCPCLFCRKSTWELDRICERCAARLEHLPTHPYRSHGAIHRGTKSPTERTAS